MDKRTEMKTGHALAGCFLTLAGLAVGYWFGLISVPATHSQPTNASGGEMDSALQPKLSDSLCSTNPARKPGREDRAPTQDIQREEIPEKDLLISVALRSHARAGIRTGWTRRRPDQIPDRLLERGLATFEKIVRESPGLIGDHLAENQTKADAASAHGDVFKLLQDLESQGDTDGVEIVKDRAKFEKLFVNESGSHAVVGTPNMSQPDDMLEDGSVLTFGPGIFYLRNLMRHKSPFPRDVTIRGAGMNATLIFHDGDLSVNGAPLKNFAMEDCTLYADNYLTALRSQPASMRLARVRVIGFDMGAGGSVAFSANQLALYAIDCRFECGYGRHPSSGYLLRSSARGFLARFDGCVFRYLSVGDASLGTIFFSGCRFEKMDGDPRRDLPKAIFQHCVVDVLDPKVRGEAPRLDLATIFPDYKKVP